MDNRMIYHSSKGFILNQRSKIYKQNPQYKLSHNNLDFIFFLNCKIQKKIEHLLL